jgi:hypothetical protein
MSRLTQSPAASGSLPALFVSWPGLARPPMTCDGAQSKVVGGPAKPGHDTIRHDTIRHDTVSRDTVCHDTISHDTVSRDTTGHVINATFPA